MGWVFQDGLLATVFSGLKFTGTLLKMLLDRTVLPFLLLPSKTLEGPQRHLELLTG